MSDPEIIKKLISTNVVKFIPRDATCPKCKHYKQVKNPFGAHCFMFFMDPKKVCEAYKPEIGETV
jgi:hypothetical protein